MFSPESYRQYLEGVNKFYEHFQRREDYGDNVVFTECSCRVINYSERNADGPIMLFIPSLINKSYILDFDENSSMVKYFASKGYRVFLIDFQDPLEDELSMKIQDYVDRLNLVIKKVCADNPTYFIGYCLGGIFSLLSNKPKNFLGQILIATPVDLSHFQKLFNLNNSLILNNFKTSISVLDRVPHFLVQLFFSYINPAQIWQKFADFSHAQDQVEIEKFLKLEQWVNDGISLSKAFVCECLDIIAENNLLNLIDSDKTCFPSLIINGTEDKIVPIESSTALYRIIDDKQVIIENTGHVGLIISNRAKENIWPAILNWMQNNKR